MLSQAAFNAFLKTLEEPPAHAVFILATTEKHKILPTILSRCQIFDFHRITVPDIVSSLQEIAVKEGVKTTPEALHVIAAKADGALRDALSMFDQLVAFAGKELTYDIVTEQLHVLDHDTYFEIVDFALNTNIPDSLLLFDSVLARGFDAHHFLSGLGNHLRSLMVCRDPRTLKLMEATPEVKTRFSEQASVADLYFIVDALSITNEADTQYRTSQHQRLLVELAVMKICSLKGSSENTLPTVEKKKSFNELIPPDLEGGVESKAMPQPKPTVSSEIPTPALVPAPEPIQVQEISSVPVVKTVVSGKLRGGGVKLAGKSKTLSETVNSDANNKENEVDESWKEEVTIEKIQAAWDLFVEVQKKDQRVSLVSTLTMCELKLKGNVVIFNVINELQEVQLNDERTDLLFHLRKNVKNALIELSIQVIPSEDGDDAPKIFLTDKERYVDMVKKNPSLDDLRKRLDLDLG